MNGMSWLLRVGAVPIKTKNFLEEAFIVEWEKRRKWFLKKRNKLGKRKARRKGQEDENVSHSLAGNSNAPTAPTSEIKMFFKASSFSGKKNVFSSTEDGGSISQHCFLWLATTIYPLQIQIWNKISASKKCWKKEKRDRENRNQPRTSSKKLRARGRRKAAHYADGRWFIRSARIDINFIN